MPRYGEAGVVSKAWQDDRPVASAVLPAAALGVGGLQLKSAIRPNPEGQIKRAKAGMQTSADAMVDAFRATKSSQYKYRAPKQGQPLRNVGRKVAGKYDKHVAGVRAGDRFKAAEMGFQNAERNLKRVTSITAPHSALPKVRRNKAILGGTLLAGGAVGAYRRLGPRPKQGAVNVQVG